MPVAPVGKVWREISRSREGGNWTQIIRHVCAVLCMVKQAEGESAVGAVLRCASLLVVEKSREENPGLIYSLCHKEIPTNLEGSPGPSSGGASCKYLAYKQFLFCKNE